MFLFPGQFSKPDAGAQDPGPDSAGKGNSVSCLGGESFPCKGLAGMAPVREADMEVEGPSSCPKARRHREWSERIENSRSVFLIGAFPAVLEKEVRAPAVPFGRNPPYTESNPHTAAFSTPGTGWPSGSMLPSHSRGWLGLVALLISGGRHWASLSGSRTAH